VPSIVPPTLVEEVGLRKGTPATRYLKLSSTLLTGCVSRKGRITSDAMAKCSEIGTIIGRPQANESFPVPSRVTMYKQVVKAAQPPKPKPKPPPRPPRPPAEPPRASAVEWDQNR
jgi:hypothetical protein